MGNTNSQTVDNDGTSLRMYSRLINMGFDDDSMCMEAADSYPKNINKAIDYILKHKQKMISKQNENTKQENKQQNLNDTHIEFNTAENDCNQISECPALNILLDTLKMYQVYKNDENNQREKMMEYFITNKRNVITSYHHILSQHLNEDRIGKKESDDAFETIYNKIVIENALCCDIQGCQILKRNHRKREEDQISKQEMIFVNILDAIHCFFLHSVDIGFRIIDTRIEINDEEKTENEYLDQQMIKIRKYLHARRKNLTRVRGFERLKTKYVTDIPTNPTTEKEQKYDKIAEDETYFFGQRYVYWDKRIIGCRNPPKYKSLKEEILNNNICCLEYNQFKEAVQKAMDLKEESETIKAMKGDTDYAYKWFNLQLESIISVNHILSIILYTDYDKLSFKMSSTFRKAENENTEELLKRNSKYGNFCKLLIETVNCYGTELKHSKLNVLYHGVSYIYFSRFTATFNAPTSTTTKIQVAANFALDGIILDLTKRDDVEYSVGVKYFNCTVFSFRPSEDERLLIQQNVPWESSLQFVTIRNMKTLENYKDIVYAINTLQRILDLSNYGKMKSIIPSETVDKINIIMDILSEKRANDGCIPPYMMCCAKIWAPRRSHINIDRDNMKQYAEGLDIWNINGKTDNNLIRYDKINKVFKNVWHFRCADIGKINRLYLEGMLQCLKLVNDLGYSQLKEIHLCGAINLLTASDISEYETVFSNNGWELKFTEESNTFFFS
eukprot:394668_1